MGEASLVKSAASRTEPYAPSWFDHLKRWVERLPVPIWLFYLALGAVLLLCQLIAQWQAGNLLPGSIPPYHAWFVLQTVYLLGVMHYLDRWAAEAFDIFRHALDISDMQAAELRYRLTNTPARSGFLVSFVVTLLSPVWLIATPATYAPLKLESSAAVLSVSMALYLMSWWVGSFTVYHTIHQLRMISRTYGELKEINLFQLHPLYALSNVTARTSVGFIIYMLCWNIAQPDTFQQPGAVAMALPLIILGGVTFLLPLWGIHKRLVAEKERRLDELGARTANAIRQLEQQVDAGDSANAIQSKDVLGGIETAQRMMERIPTWPWQPETIRLLITALLLPIVLFAVQFAIQKLIAP